ncbi:Holliday junction resolvase [Antribacter gilvus]|uniref:Holliday junction resolvase n=1 Tax=Antribacter gilvus TaxID=2304675 RepID=UPI000F787E23|nr:Holliday junction resolvase [Antribacter gilvus]
MTHYQRGRRLEWDVQHDLAAHGYITLRAASSKGAADVIGFKPGQVVFVQAKTNGLIPPAERVALLHLASLIPGALAIVAARPTTTYRRLTGPGPKDWVSWTPDELEEVTA